MTNEPQRSIEPPAEIPLATPVVERPRVLLVGPMPPTKGGVTTFMLNLMASYLRHDVAFIAFTTSRPPKRNVIDNWGYGALLRGGVRRMLTGMLITLWHLLKFPIVVVCQRIALVQIQASDYFVFWEAALYAVMARLLGRPVLLRLGGAFDIFYGGSSAPMRRLISAVLNLPQGVIAQSEFASGCIRRAGRRGPMVILSNWAQDANNVEVLRTPGTAPVFLFVAGTEARRKGVEQVLAAAENLQRSGSPARFHFLAMTPALVERATNLKLANIRAIEGPASHAHVLELMRAADVFLLPSHGEGFPNALIEAMTAGMAAIVTPVGAVPEIVADGGALTIPIGDVEALTAAIDRLARDGALRARLGREARATVLARYTESRALPPLATAYRNLLNSRA